MTIKDREDTLRTNMHAYMILSLVFWLGFTAFMIYGVFSTTRIPTLPLTSIKINVPSVKEDNLNVLRKSIKSTPPSSMNLPVIRSEPYN